MVSTGKIGAFYDTIIYYYIVNSDVFVKLNYFAIVLISIECRTYHNNGSI